jgi:hypothetical protein
MSVINDLVNRARNTVLNAIGVERDMETLLKDKDISKVKGLFLDFSEQVEEAMKEYDPEQHGVMIRPDKPRKNRDDYKVEKLPRTWQRYINEVALFFLFGKPVKWTNNDKTGASDKAFEAFQNLLKETRFNSSMRETKRRAGSETISAKLYYPYRDEENNPHVKVIVLSKKDGYDLRPLFDQYKKLLALGYGYWLKEGDTSVEHFDILTPKTLYYCKRGMTGWVVEMKDNLVEKINAIVYIQDREWDGTQRRIERDEMLDSKTADTNNYFADPMAAATTDVIRSLADPEAIGKLVILSSKDSEFKYIDPPTSSETREGEKKVNREAILNDSFTPDFSFESMKGLGTLSGEAIRRAMILGYIKRDNLKEIYELAIDREKNLIIAIMKKVTHISLAKELDKLDVSFEFSEPFDEDALAKMESISTALSAGAISIETAVTMLGFVKDVGEEVEKIKNDKQQSNRSVPAGVEREATQV